MAFIVVKIYTRCNVSPTGVEGADNIKEPNVASVALTDVDFF